MFRLIISRLFQAVPTLFVVAALVFVMIDLAPGGPFSEDRALAPEAIEQLNERYGLDQPVYVRFYHYISNVLLHGDFDESFKHKGQSVSALISQAFPVSLELGLWAFSFALLFGVPLGVIAAVRRNSVLDYSASFISLLGICLPNFVVAPILIFFVCLEFVFLRPTGWSFPEDRILPALTLGFAYAAYVARLTRGGMMETLSKPYIRTARAKGLSESKLIVKHALRGGLLPVVAYLGPAFAGLITGSFVVETIFYIPGLGRLFVNAALSRDHFLTMGIVLFYAALVLFANLISDLLQAWLNPRILEEAS